MLMGIIGNIREKLGNKVHEIQENRARDKAEYREHYNREFEAARKREIQKSAREKAASDAYARVHPLESAAKKLQGFGERMDAKGRGSPNSLGRRLSPLGDVGRSIGRQYDNMEKPSWMRDFDKPKKSRKNPLMS